MTPQFLFGNVMHKRFFPRINQFTYKIYYLVLPLSKIDKQLEVSGIKFNRFGLLSFYNKDHGHRDGKDLKIWADKTLKSQGVHDADGEIVLVAMPRVFGYVFNPVSFWYCYDKLQNLKAVICEVNNTFGETHTYVCHVDDQIFDKETITQANKVFHVSPFLTRDGHYKFRFATDTKKMGVWIDYFHDNGKKQLITALTGTFAPLNRLNFNKAFWRYPLITFRAIFLIHWQAVKLIIKKIKYVPKPEQLKTRVTKAKKNEAS